MMNAHDCIVCGRVRGASLVGCATTPSDAETQRARPPQMMKASFKARGQAKLDRLDQDETQKHLQPVRRQGAAEGRRREDREAEPRDDQVAGRRQVLGDWKNGEKIAQDGRGKQFSDDPAGPVGGNCYACHQLAPQELSYGTIGPSLYQFGKLRGYNDETRKYAYGKIYNAEAYRRVLATCRASATTAS